jgi:hypothetical protein
LTGKLKTNDLKKFKFDPFAYYIYTTVIAVLVVVIIFHYLVTIPYFQSLENLEWYRRFLYFDYMFLLFFSFTSIFLGFFLAYLGHGGNQKVGLYFMLIGLFVFILGFYYFNQLFPRPIYNPSNVFQAIVSVLATMAGFIAAILVAFIVITKVGPHITNLGKREETEIKKAPSINTLDHQIVMKKGLRKKR